MSLAYTQTIPTPNGPFTIVATDDAVLASGWTLEVAALTKLVPPGQRPTAVRNERLGTAMRQAIIGVEAYYEGFFGPILAVPVALPNAPFRARCRQLLRSIKRGTVITYGQLAAWAGEPTAARAAGGACATNATALFLPCHRVCRTDGGLGGFLYGLDIKRSLLAREGVSGFDGEQS